ncbi:MCE family protein [Mycolicibacterium pulveris]|uniref:Putative Mce family protein n=1 Tax=Mycolicibacterium pulveris TaxID=36813 RepID=A0A7I7UJJ3_MYCPV|nr:MlaD family protein [Mycolicibacterium pulveris]MCV6980144.1 MCE family protein [Mycolicibacterium pulveris]BBY81525.1 putative Mce family protein [Mycolicibacterium pulveris]
MTRRLTRVLGALASLVLVSSCSALTVDSLPQPGGDRDGYDVRLEFANVLNLPDRARVVMDGVTVGVVTDVEVVGDRVDVMSRIDSGVVIPSDIRGILQQPTVLGDIYVALQRSPDTANSAPPLRPGDTVPLAHTTSPPQIEDTIATLANFVASGSIQRAQDAMIGLNRVAQTSDIELGAVMTQVSTNLSELADNLESVALTLDGLTDTATVLSSRRAAIGHWFSPAGMLGFDRATQVTSRLGVMIPSIGSVYSGGFWLVPMLTTLGDAWGSVQATKWAVEDELPRWRSLFTDYFLPQDKYPAINITSIVGPDGRELSGDVADVLRILGAAP